MKNSVKIISALLAIVFVLAFAACSSNNGGGAKPLVTRGPASTLDPNRDIKKSGTFSEDLAKQKVSVKSVSDLPITVRVDDCFRNKGYFVFTAREAMELTADFGEGDALEWIIYITDAQFDGDLKLIPEKLEPSVTENGASFGVKAGQFVYIYCPVNAENAAEPREASPLTLTGKAA